MTALEQPGFEYADTVAPSRESIDYNGHVNVGYYGVFFDMAADNWLARHGLSEADIRASGHSIFVSESRTRYFREVLPDGRMDVHFRVESLSRKALLAHLLMISPETGDPIAAAEVLWLSVDLSTRRVSPMPDSVFAALSAAKERHHRNVPTVPFKGTIAFRP